MYDFTQTKEDLAKSIEWLKAEYANVHTGQASPAILDSIKVDSYGSMQPIKNIASITVEDARTLRVAPWDKNQIKDIEKSVTEADLGLSVSVDDAGVRINFPQLTEESRAKIVKVLKGKLEDARVTIRKERENTIKDIDGGDMSDDEKHDAKEDLQKMIDDANKQLEEVFKQKEENTMKV
jgi:ribosome recycling factor